MTTPTFALGNDLASNSTWSTSSVHTHTVGSASTASVSEASTAPSKPAGTGLGLACPIQKYHLGSDVLTCGTAISDKRNPYGGFENINRLLTHIKNCHLKNDKNQTPSEFVVLMTDDQAKQFREITKGSPKDKWYQILFIIRPDIKAQQGQPGFSRDQYPMTYEPPKRQIPQYIPNLKTMAPGAVSSDQPTNHNNPLPPPIHTAAEKNQDFQYFGTQFNNNTLSNDIYSDDAMLDGTDLDWLVSVEPPRLDAPGFSGIGFDNRVDNVGPGGLGI